MCLLAAPPDTREALLAASAGLVSVSQALEGDSYDLIFTWPERLAGLNGHFADLQRRITPQGAIWAVMPKKKHAARRGIDFTWEQMQAAALQTDLVDNKTASISEQEYGTRFVIRSNRREKRG